MKKEAAKIEDFFNMDKKAGKSIQVRVSESVYNEANKKRLSQARSWVEVVEACLKAYVSMGAGK